jgi:hypothetical protein
MTIQWIKWQIKFKINEHEYTGPWKYHIQSHDTPYDSIYETYIKYDEPPFYNGFIWELIESPPIEFIQEDIKFCNSFIKQKQEYLSKLQETLNPSEFHNNCPNCRRSMLSFSSYQYKQCVECGQTYDWKLEPKQLPLVRHQR